MIDFGNDLGIYRKFDKIKTSFMVTLRKKLTNLWCDYCFIQQKVKWREKGVERIFFISIFSNPLSNPESKKITNNSHIQGFYHKNLNATFRNCNCFPIIIIVNNQFLMFQKRKMMDYWRSRFRGSRLLNFFEEETGINYTAFVKFELVFKKLYQFLQE